LISGHETDPPLTPAVKSGPDPSSSVEARSRSLVPDQLSFVGVILRLSQ